jgi:hypothetical protein
MDPYSLDWGTITPEGFSSDKNIALHVFNFFLKDEENRSLSIKFIAGKVKWYSTHLPEDCSQIIRVDARGQELDFEVLIDFKEALRNAISQKVKKIKFELEILTN